jgi:hypothetical protein
VGVAALAVSTPQSSEGCVEGRVKLPKRIAFLPPLPVFAIWKATHMERVARVLNSSKIKTVLITDEEVVRAVWPAAVGKVIAGYTSRIRMVRGKVIVEVADAIWQKQLFTLSRQIMGRLQQATGNKSVTDIEFRVGVPRREPQRADGSRNPLFAAVDGNDEAETIQDPVLKKVYQLSRRKATA